MAMCGFLVVSFRRLSPGWARGVYLTGRVPILFPGLRLVVLLDLLPDL